MSTASTHSKALTGHPGEDMLWDYHRGALPPGLALTVSTHLDRCPHCRSDLRVFDCVGGAMLEQIEGVEMSASALDLALARIERPEETPDTRKPVKHPAFLQGFDLPESLKTTAISGRYWAAPGVWIAPVHIDGAPKGSKTYLMHVKAGMIMPVHSHRGRETTVVLKGRFADHTGEYGPGDFMSISDDETHAPGVPEGEDCLCLIAQEALIVPHTWLGKVLQPFARI
jgi:putative transcriptional regulator